MAKNNFIPLCMIPFIANMMSDREGGEEPEPSYYTLKKLDFFISLFKIPASSGEEGGPYFAVGVTASPELLAAVNAGKDILLPADFTDLSYFAPEGVTEETFAEYVDSLYETKKEEYPYLIRSDSQMFMEGFSELGLQKPEGEALWMHGTEETPTYGFDEVPGFWSWSENEHDGQHYITYQNNGLS